MTQFPQCEAFSRSMLFDGTGGWESSNRQPAPLFSGTMHTTTALKPSVNLHHDYLDPYDRHPYRNNGPPAGTDSALTSIPALEATRRTVQEAGNSNIDGVENTPVTYYVDGEEGYKPFIDGMCDLTLGAPATSKDPFLAR